MQRSNHDPHRSGRDGVPVAPGAVVRRHANDDPLPSWLDDDAAASRALLTSFAIDVPVGAMP